MAFFKIKILLRFVRVPHKIVKLKSSINDRGGMVDKIFAGNGIGDMHSNGVVASRVGSASKRAGNSLASRRRAVQDFVDAGVYRHLSCMERKQKERLSVSNRAHPAGRWLHAQLTTGPLTTQSFVGNTVSTVLP